MRHKCRLAADLARLDGGSADNVQAVLALAIERDTNFLAHLFVLAIAFVALFSGSAGSAAPTAAAVTVQRLLPAPVWPC